MHILVTGGAGYIGSHVVKQLIEYTDYDVTIIDNLSTGSKETIYALRDILNEQGSAKRLNFIKEDLFNFKSIETIFANNKFDALIHFAASIVVPESVQNPLKYYMNNTVNTINIISLCNKYSVKLVFSSTAAVYGEPKTIPVTENASLEPINPYGWSKRMSEQVIIDAAASQNFKYVIFRYFNVAGADTKNRIGQSFPNATHLIKVAAQTAIGKRKKMSIYGNDYKTPDGTCIRDYIHVDDLAFAHIMALGYLKEFDSDIFNVGYGKGYSVKEVIDTMKNVSGVDFCVEQEKRRAGDPAWLISDNRKIITAYSNLKEFRLKNRFPKLFRYDNLELICKTALDWEKRCDL